MATLGFRLLDARHLPDAGQRVLDRLAAETGEYCRLALVENGRLCWVAYAQGATQGLRYDPPMSGEIMLHATATGKAWLSTLPEVEAFRLVYAQGFPVPAGVREDSLGSNVIRSIDALRAELAATRERGYALAEHEAEAGTVALAVTFRARADADAPTLGTISVAGPSVRFEGPEREILACGTPSRRRRRAFGNLAGLEAAASRVFQGSGRDAAHRSCRRRGSVGLVAPGSDQLARRPGCASDRQCRMSRVPHLGSARPGW